MSILGCLGACLFDVRKFVGICSGFSILVYALTLDFVICDP